MTGGRTVLVSNLMMLRERERFDAELRRRGFEPIWADVRQFLSEAECLHYAGKIDAWLAGDDSITRQVLERFSPRLKGISKWGTGIDSIDLDSAKELRVSVLNTPGAFSEAVAEVALGYMLILTRHLNEVDRAVRAGEWPKPVGLGLYGRICGLIGFGAIGQGVARRAIGCGMSILAYDPHFAPRADAPTAQLVELEALLAGSDVVCLCCNLTPDNHHLIGEAQLKAMKPDAVVINVARGPLIDEHALAAALQGRWISGAGLDVFETEPLPKDSALRDLKNVVLGSHNANNLRSAVEHVHTNTLDNLEAIMRRTPDICAD